MKLKTLLRHRQGFPFESFGKRHRHDRLSQKQRLVTVSLENNDRSHVFLVEGFLQSRHQSAVLRAATKSKPSETSEERGFQLGAFQQRVELIFQLVLIASEIKEEIDVVSHDRHSIFRRKLIDKYFRGSNTSFQIRQLAGAVVDYQNERARYADVVAVEKVFDFLRRAVFHNRKVAG